MMQDTRDLPSHIAIILDGNNRWQETPSYLKTRYASGHEAGAGAVEKLLDGALSRGVPYLTLFAFSTENWHRDLDEVMHLLRLFERVATDKKALQRFSKQGVRFHTIGDIDAFASHLPTLPNNLRCLSAKTQDNTNLVLTVALNYGGRWDITQAARLLAQEAVSGGIQPEAIDEDCFAAHLSTAQLALPDPDLLIRTSNEIRISNFLLWQCAYSELYFTDVLWPDFTAADLDQAIAQYQTRKRRFGARI